MILLHRLASIIDWLVHRERAEQQLDDDVRAFVELSAAEKVRDGVPREEARRQAILELGGVEQTKERVRTYRHGALLDEVGRDMRYACRTFVRQPGFTFVIVLTLTLGIGANTAIFSLIDALMLRSLPVRNPEELIQLKLHTRGERDFSESFSYPMVGALDEHREILAGVAGFSSFRFDVGPAGGVGAVSGAVVTGAYYETLGLNPAIGRLLAREDDRPGADLVAVISHGYWERQFGRSPTVLANTIVMNGVPVTIVGVSPRGFVGANVGSIADITIPIAAIPRVAPDAAPLLGAGNFWLRVLARPQTGVSNPEVKARLAALWPQTAERVIAPNWPVARRKAMAQSVFEISRGGTGWSYLRAKYVRPLLVLMVVVTVVLLIACANVASLLLARASARQREIAVRLAIGAGRARIVRQLLIESMLLSAIGAAFGIGLAWLSGGFLVNLISTAGSHVVFDLTPNWHVLGFTTAVAMATSLFFGLAPALQSTAVTPSAEALKEDTRISGTRSRLLPSLVSAQVALSLVLLVGAGLFTRTLQNLRHFDPGFKPEGVLLVDLEARRMPLRQELLEEVQRVPGVVSASMSTHTPLSGSIWSEPAVPAGQPVPERDNAFFVGAGPRFFATMQIQLLAGREFTERDSTGAPAVAVVNETFARRHFADQNPVGRHLSANVRNTRKDLEIVGLAKNTSAAGLRAAPPPTVYVAYAQLAGDFSTTLEMRVAGSLGETASAVRQVVQRKLPNVSIDVRPLSAQVGATMVQERMMATLAGGFAVVALVLACIGLYGLLAYSVARRTREIGIRMALGAQRARVVTLVLRGAARLVAIGIVVGLAAAWAALRWVETMLFGLTPTDPAAIAGAIVLLTTAAQLAAYLPARRASLVDPVAALRHD